MEMNKQHALDFQALSHPVRLNILEILARGPTCVCDLVRLTGKRQPFISQHLAILRQVSLVTTRRQGWNIVYELNDAKLAELEQVILTLSQQTPRLEADFGKSF
jgi:ArsR family transcriptional regulator, lead/cadmium/zinc/bismuth-responsive transcriptional repressor